MNTVLAIINSVFVIVALTLVIGISRAAAKFEWAFGDDQKRERLSYRFMRLLVAAVIVGLIAAAVNLFVLGAM